MNEPWWLPSTSTVHLISTVLWAVLKLVGIIYVIYRLESIAEAVRADEPSDEEIPE